MRKFALLIGVGSYRSSDLQDLLAAPRDVEAMQRVLVDPAIGGFAVEDVCVLTDPGAQDMRVAIARLFVDRDRDDLLLLYFSGHGLADEGVLYLTATETERSLLDATAIEASYIHRLMERRGRDRSQRQVVILDCCYSGAFAKGMAAKGGGVNLLSELGGKGRAVLTSSSETEPSFEQKDSELSVYTQYLVEGLRTGIADQDNDGQISVDELHEFAAMKVKEAAPEMQPKIYVVEEGYKIIVAKAPVGEPRDPRLVFRKEVEKLAKKREGVVPKRLKNALVRRFQGQLSIDEINEILGEVLQTCREENLQKYQAAVKASSEMPMSQRVINLHFLQHDLGLQDKDVKPFFAAVAPVANPATKLRREVANLELLSRLGLEPFTNGTIKKWSAESDFREINNVKALALTERHELFRQLRLTVKESQPAAAIVNKLLKKLGYRITAIRHRALENTRSTWFSIETAEPIEMVAGDDCEMTTLDVLSHDLPRPDLVADEIHTAVAIELHRQD